jgi:hypothetical protein
MQLNFQQVARDGFVFHLEVLETRRFIFQGVLNTEYWIL